MFSKHHFGARACGPVGSVIYQLCVTSIWTSMLTGPHGAWGRAPGGLSPGQSGGAQSSHDHVNMCGPVSTSVPNAISSAVHEFDLGGSSLICVQGGMETGKAAPRRDVPLSLCSEQPVHGWWEAVLLHALGGEALGEVAVWPWGLAPPEPRRWRGRRGPVTIR